MEKNAQIWCLYGDTKVGKSMLSRSYPRPLLVLDSVFKLPPDVYMEMGCDFLPIHTMDGLRENYTKLQAAGKYTTIVFDHADSLYGIIEKQVCAELGIKQVGEAGGGVDYGMIREKFINLLLAFTYLPNIKHVVAVFQATKSQPDDLGRLFWSLGLSGRTARAFSDIVDHIGFVYAERNPVGNKLEKKVTFCPCDTYSAGSVNRFLNCNTYVCDVLENAIGAGSCDLRFVQDVMTKIIDNADKKRGEVEAAERQGKVGR